MTFVELKAVSLTYRLGKETTLALADGTMAIGKGEFVAVVGAVGLRQVDHHEAGHRALPATSGEVVGRGQR
jgi:NitT/TauT family transport system ATP-binding protein